MDAIAQYFDHYVITARIKPAFFVVLPLAVTALVWWPQSHELGGAIVTFLVTFGAIGFLSNLISNAGNGLQSKLFEEWGGAPTTALLRHRDGHLNPSTKQRYHRRLEQLVIGLTMPTTQFEAENLVEADERYISATTCLRELTRDKSRFPMVYADNVSYGYARNLLAMRGWGVISALIALLINLALLYPAVSMLIRFNQDIPATWPNILAAISLAVALAMLWIFSVTVNGEYVRGRAVRYATSLLAVCDSLELRE